MTATGRTGLCIHGVLLVRDDLRDRGAGSTIWAAKYPFHEAQNRIDHRCEAFSDIMFLGFRDPGDREGVVCRVAATDAAYTRTGRLRIGAKITVAFRSAKGDSTTLKSQPSPKEGPAMHVFSMLLCALLGPSATEVPPVDPSPRLSRIEPGRQWTFRDPAQDWVREHNCEVSVADGLLKIRATGFDPYLHTPVRLPAGHMIFRMKARTRIDSPGRDLLDDAAGRTVRIPGQTLPAVSDGQWHEYSVRFVADSPIIDLRLDPGDDVGEFDVEWIRVDYEHLHPLVIRPGEVSRRSVAFAVTNEDAAACRFTAEGKAYSLDAGRSMTLRRPIPGLHAVEPVTLATECAGFPPARRTVFVYNPDAQAEWILLPDSPDGRRGASPLQVRVARDGSAARFELGGQTVALLGPLVHVDGEIPALKLVEKGPGLRLEAPGLTVALAQTGDEVSVALDSSSAL